jgi:hypothetical protein
VGRPKGSTNKKTDAWLAYRLEKKREAGKLQAQVEAEKKKPLEISLREHIGKMIDRFTADDTINVTAWLGRAYLIRPMIQVSPHIVARYKDLSNRRAILTGPVEPALGLKIITEQLGFKIPWLKP